MYGSDLVNLKRESREERVTGKILKGKSVAKTKPLLVNNWLILRPVSTVNFKLHIQPLPIIQNVITSYFDTLVQVKEIKRPH